MLRPFLNMHYAPHPRLINHSVMRGKVSLERNGDSVYVIFTDKIFVGSPFRMPQSFSAEFTDQEILASNNVQRWLAGITGYSLTSTWSL